MKDIKRIGALGSLFIGLSFPTFAQDILTSTPVTYMLASQLTKGTELTTQYLPPKRYGVERVANWYSTKGKELVTSSGENATVAVTLRALWPQDPTYVYPRQSNIRLVEIDASQAISPRAQGVAALTLEDGSTSKYAWLNPSNLTRMAAIVSEDLLRVYPEYKEEIVSNHQMLAVEIRKLVNQQQAALFDKEIDSVVLVDEALEDFASGNQLFVVGRQYNAPLEWTEQDKAKLKHAAEEDPSLWFVTAKKPSKELLSVVDASRILQVDSVDRWGSKGISSDEPLKRWEIR